MKNRLKLRIRKMDNVTLKIEVVVTQELRLRMWLAKLLLSMVGRVLTGSRAKIKIRNQCDEKGLDESLMDHLSEAAVEKTLNTTQAQTQCDPLQERMVTGGVVNVSYPRTELQLTSQDIAAIRRWFPHHPSLFQPKPISMLLFCPRCNLQHVDEPHGDWTNPPHRSHECQQCSYTWRPSDAYTMGVLSLQTSGKRDGMARPNILPSGWPDRT